MREYRPKRIVLCSDGTGNTVVKNRGTNVWKTYEAVDVNGHKYDETRVEQVAFYDDGVGTDDLKLLKILGGAFGWGLSRNVRQLYAMLCRAYNPGDEIYLFGFSRGAHTIRTLGGMIVRCGIVDSLTEGLTDEQLEARVREGYAAFRKHFRRSKDAEAATSDFRRRYAWKKPDPDGRGRIKFIGVWDTVAAMGLPVKEMTTFWNRVVYPFTFPTARLSRQVEKACQALAIDDERHTFHPDLWDQEGERDSDRIEQVWFAGVHSNVGGGYPKQGMSLVALDWMMSKAEEQGLRFIPSERERYRAAQNVHDKLYDPRAGLKVLWRYKPRDIAELCAEANATPAKIHVSAFERLLLTTQGYAPSNLPDRFEVVDYPGRPPGDQHVTGFDEMLLTMRMIGGISSDPATLARLGRSRKWVDLRRWLHAALVLFLLGIVGVAVALSGAAAGLDPVYPEWTTRLFRGAASTVPLVGSRIDRYVVQPLLVYPGFLIALAAATAVLFGLARLARRRIHTIFSDYWRQRQGAPD